MFYIITLFTMLNTTDMQVNEGCGVVMLKQGSTVTVMYQDKYEVRQDNRLDMGDEYCPVDAPVYVASK